MNKTQKEEEEKKNQTNKYADNIGKRSWGAAARDE